VKFQKDRPGSPTPAGSKDKPEGRGGILGMLSGLIPAIISGIAVLGSKVISGITGAISGLGSLILQGITSALSISNLMKAFGVVTEALGGILKLATMVATNPLFLAMAAITGVAALLAFLRADYDKDKARYMDLALKKKEKGLLTENEQKELEKLERPNFRKESIRNFGFDPKTGKEVDKNITNEELNIMNRAETLRILQPGTAKEYLKAGEEFYKSEGYTKQQLEIMATGKKVDLSQPSGVTPTLAPSSQTPYNAAKDSQAASATVGRSSSGRVTPAPTTTKPVQVPSSTPSRAPTATQTNGVELLNRAMDKEGITDPIVRDRVTKLAMVESSMNPTAKGPVIPSGMHKGDQAQGLLQIMPKTAEGIGFSREQIADPEIAAIAGVRYFKMNLKRFNDNLDAATVAHHSGPGGAKRWLESGSAGTKDLATGLSTDNYLTKVTGSPTLSPPMATLAAAAPTRPSSIISDSTVALAEVKERTSSAPIVVNAPQTVNNVQQGSQAVTQYTAPSIVDSEFMRMLVSRAV
jgi:hypothetical protein